MITISDTEFPKVGKVYQKGQVTGVVDRVQSDDDLINWYVGGLQNTTGLDQHAISQPLIPTNIKRW